jgi:hypothetical protein
VGENVSGMEMTVNGLANIDLKYSKPKALSEIAENPPFEEDKRVSHRRKQIYYELIDN